MNLKRIDVALEFLFLLLTKKQVITKEFLKNKDISIATFKRVVSEIRCWLSNCEHRNISLEYDKKNSCYYLLEENNNFF